METINSQAKWYLKIVKSEKERLVHVSFRISASFFVCSYGGTGALANAIYFLINLSILLVLLHYLL